MIYFNSKGEAEKSPGNIWKSFELRKKQLKLMEKSKVFIFHIKFQMINELL